MKKILAIFAIIAFTFAMPACKSKVSDADIKAAVDAKLQSNADYSGVTADVKDGVVTLSGSVKDDLTKASLVDALRAEKGVQSVANNTTVTPAPVITPDDPLTTSVKDAVKDNPTVQAMVANGVVTLTGEIKKADLPKLMQKINATHPKKIDNKLTVK